ncbi:hypothetical protein LZ32DRAFT_674338 [Colletotrichum eremochloae]|nr:hypothetical protein LZ32DRAFT_674338 [Colletotrichum eremochloae]
MDLARPRWCRAERCFSSRSSLSKVSIFSKQSFRNCSLSASRRRRSWTRFDSFVDLLFQFSVVLVVDLLNHSDLRGRFSDASRPSRCTSVPVDRNRWPYVQGDRHDRENPLARAGDE